MVSNIPQKYHRIPVDVLPSDSEDLFASSMLFKLGYLWQILYPKRNLPQKKRDMYGFQWEIPSPIAASTPVWVKFNHVVHKSHLIMFYMGLIAKF